jgi:hypothetical protein
MTALRVRRSDACALIQLDMTPIASVVGRK